MGWLTIDAMRPAGSGRAGAGRRSRPIERKLALVAVITALLALLPAVLKTESAPDATADMTTSVHVAAELDGVLVQGGAGRDGER